MKFIWEEKDITGGVLFSRPGLKEQCIIGYMPQAGNNIVCVTSLQDGYVQQFTSKIALADYLTDNKYTPVVWKLEVVE